MKSIALKWNSRTLEGSSFSDDEDFTQIIEFLKAPAPDRFILGFYSYDDKESEEFREQLKKQIIKGLKDKNWHWLDLDFDFNHKSGEKSTDSIIERIKEIPEKNSGVVALFEPIIYHHKAEDEVKNKRKFHKELVMELWRREGHLKLLLFGNIPYDIHYLKDIRNNQDEDLNSPLVRYIKQMYTIADYEESEVEILPKLRETIAKKILDHCGGHFEITKDIEGFWRSLGVEKRMEELAERFLILPIKTKLEKTVLQKLHDLSQFVEETKK